MKRHLLVTISDDPHAFAAVRFLGQFCTDTRGLDCTLFFVVAHTSSRDQTPDAQALAHGEAALRKAKALFEEYGWPPRQVHRKTFIQRQPTAMEIVEEWGRARYDAVVLGHRGISTLEALLRASVSQELLHTRLAFPLWLCRKPEPSRRGILCCVDGSPQAYRVVAHVGTLHRALRGHLITLCGVEDGNHPHLERVFDKCRGLLLESGVVKGMIRQQLLQGGDPAKALKTELHTGGYAVIAMGRTGAGKGPLGSLFYGSVSSKLVQHAAPATAIISQ